MARLSKDKRDRMILVYLVSVFAIAAAYLLLVKSQQEKLKQMAAETSNVEDQINGTRRLLAQQDQFEIANDRLRAELSVREAGMANGDLLFWFVNMFKKFASDYKVDIPQISPAVTGPVVMFPAFPYEAATFKVSGSAHFYEFGRFLRDFENRYPYVRVQNLDLEPDSTPESEKITFRMDVVTLIKPSNS